MQFFYDTTTGNNRSPEMAGDYKTWQKITDVFKDLPDFQVKLEHNEIIILSDVTKLEKEYYGRLRLKYTT